MQDAVAVQIRQRRQELTDHGHELGQLATRGSGGKRLLPGSSSTVKNGEPLIEAVVKDADDAGVAGGMARGAGTHWRWIRGAGAGARPAFCTVAAAVGSVVALLAAGSCAGSALVTASEVSGRPKAPGGGIAPRA